MLSLLSAGRPPSADDSQTISALCMRDEENSSPSGATDGDCTLFVFGVVWIDESERCRIKKHRRCLLEGNAVLPHICSGLGRIPLVRQADSPSAFSSSGCWRLFSAPEQDIAGSTMASTIEPLN
jgi:hypothetical protein